MTYVLSIDPGKQLSYGALSCDGDIIQAEPFPLSFARPCTIVGELPQVYQGGKSRSDPDDLIRLAYALGITVGVYEKYAEKIVLLKPNEWKGQVPKDIMKQRIDALLSPTEKAVIDEARWKVPPKKMHNIYDAVGINLHYTGRLKR